MKQVKLSEKIDKMLNQLSKKRKKDGNFIKSKQDINAEAVEILYNKEFKK